MTNNFVCMGLLLAFNVHCVVGLPSLLIWPNDTTTVQLGNIRNYYCRIYGVPEFFANAPHFFQAKGEIIFMQNSTNIDVDTVVLRKTIDLSDDDTEIFCRWDPIKTRSDVFPSTLLSKRIPIRFNELEEKCASGAWWQWLAGIAAVVVGTLVVAVVAYCRRARVREEQPTPESGYSYATAPVLSWEEAHARAANNRPLPRFQAVVPRLPPRNAELQAEYEYINPNALRR